MDRYRQRVTQPAATLIALSELYDVRHGSEGVFISLLSVRTLPGLHRPCMRTMLDRLDDLNLLTLGDEAESPLDALELAIGEYVGQLSLWAQGIDHTPALPPTIQPSLEETVILEPDEVHGPVLWGTLLDVLQRLCRTLCGQRRVCRTLPSQSPTEITLRLRSVSGLQRKRVGRFTCLLSMLTITSLPTFTINRLRKNSVAGQAVIR